MKELNKYFVPYNRAKKLEILGFDWDCMGWYISSENVLAFGNAKKNCLLKESSILAPTFSQAFDWFRETYWLYSQTPSSWIDEGIRTFYNNPIYDESDNIVFQLMEHYRTYEEAELACLDKLIEIAEKL